MTSTHHGTNSLKIWVEHSPRLVIGVTDIVARHWLLLAKLTHPCHDHSPSYLNELGLKSGDSITAEWMATSMRGTFMSIS